DQWRQLEEREWTRDLPTSAPNRNRLSGFSAARGSHRRSERTLRPRGHRRTKSDHSLQSRACSDAGGPVIEGDEFSARAFRGGAAAGRIARALVNDPFV